MTIGDAYVTVSDLVDEFGIGDADDDVSLELAAEAASAWVTSHCGRDFNIAPSASARLFYAASVGVVRVDDISSAADLVIESDTNGNGTFDTTWTAADYQLEPLNGINAGVTGWPYTAIRSVGSKCWPITARPSIQVTAVWGWPEVPAPVKRATLIQAARIYKRRFSPEGVLGGFDGISAVRVGTRLDPDVQALLAPYVVAPIAAA